MNWERNCQAHPERSHCLGIPPGNGVSTLKCVATQCGRTCAYTEACMMCMHSAWPAVVGSYLWCKPILTKLWMHWFIQSWPLASIGVDTGLST